MTGPQGGGGSFNFTDAIDTHSDYVTWMLQTDARGRARRRRREQPRPETSTPSTAAQADIATAPLRDCLSYYNGHGDAAPGSLAYYGGGRRGSGTASRPRRRWRRTCSARSQRSAAEAQARLAGARSSVHSTNVSRSANRHTSPSRR